MTDHDKSYKQRQQKENIGEVLFEAWCKKNNKTCVRMGFDEKNKNIPNFFLLPRLLRNLPDYAVADLKRPGTLVLVHVKGTTKLKVDDFQTYMEFYRKFCIPDVGVDLVVAFCFEGKEPVFKSMADLEVETFGQKRNVFPLDGKLYYEISMEETDYSRRTIEPEWVGGDEE